MRTPPTSTARSLRPGRAGSERPAAPALRVLAHPLRSRLLGQLRIHGPSTATRLATELGTNSGATSYHLRVLAAVGLVQDTAGGSGRERVWAAPDQERRRADADVLDEDDAAAAAWLDRDYVEHFAEQSVRWLADQASWPLPWRDVCGLRDQTVLVSLEQLTALHVELAEVLERYRRVGAGNPDAKRVSIYRSALPADRPPGSPRT